jgi:type IV pilus assembly protein PilW
MKRARPRLPGSACRSQRGFTLVELLVSILIGLFLAGGLLTLTSAMKRTYSIQGSLSQLSDNQRVGLTIMTDVIQQAGHFNNPTVKTAATAMPAIGTTWSAGQAVLGAGSYPTNPTETLSVRYMTTGTVNDGLLNCLGVSSATATPAAPVTWINTFSLDGNGNLQCTVTTNGVAGTPVTLMTGVVNMYFFYGVQTNTASGTNSVDNVLQAPAVTSGGYWLNVMSVELVVFFTNPLYAAAGTAATAGQSAAQPATLGISRWVALMSMVGVTS